MKTIATLVLLTLVAVPTAWAQSSQTPVIDQRQANQERRIDQGIASGELNRREARRLDRQQNHIDNVENRAKSDGTVTARERARIGAAQARASHDIFREKHDRQGARGR